jgi:hypothetical protein
MTSFHLLVRILKEGAHRGCIVRMNKSTLEHIKELNSFGGDIDKIKRLNRIATPYEIFGLPILIDEKLANGEWELRKVSDGSIAAKYMEPADESESE